MKTPSEQRRFEQFPFISTTSALHDDNSRRRLVRSYARHAAGRKQKTLLASGSLGSRLQSPTPFSQHVGKFKIAIPAPKRGKTLKSKPQPQQLQDIRPINAKSGALLRKDFTPANYHQAVLHLVPDHGRLDPFNSLPITVGPQQETLLYYYKSKLKTSFLAFDPHADLISHSALDSAWLNATLSLVALYRDMYLENEISLECLFHRGEALRLVNERLAEMADNLLTNATIGAVALLANFDITIGALSNATIHMNGLQKLVSLRGGIETFEPNSLLQGLVTWSDLQYASSWDSGQPRFRFACVSPKQAPTPICVQDAETYFTHLSDSPGFNVEMQEICQIMRHISVVKDASTNNDTRAQFSSCIYLAEYRLITLFKQWALVHTSMHFRKPLHLALHLYLHLALRELPPVSQVQRNLANRLQNMLEKASQNLQYLWVNDLSTLLWIMFMGGAASSEGSRKGFFVEQIFDISNAMGITSFLEFRSILKTVVWVRTYCDPQSKLIWAEVERRMLAT